MSKLLSKPKKKMKKLLSNKRKGYSKLMVTSNDNKSMHSMDYEDEDLEMDLELNYDMNASYNYQADPHNELSTIIGPTTTSQPIAPSLTQERPSNSGVTQTYIDDIMDKGISRKTEYCVVPFYLLVCILSMITTALLCIGQVDDELGMTILNGFTVIGAAMGMYGVYLWGVFDDVIAYLTKLNESYKDNIDRLNSMGEVLQNDVDDINQSIDGLKRDGNALENTMNQYKDLQRELQEIADKNGDNQDVMSLLDEYTNLSDNLETVIEDNEKAHLLSIFYSVKLYDYGNKNCMNKKQYKQFLMHCNSKTRKKFEIEGGFESMDKENKGWINMSQFEEMVHKILNVTIQESQHLLNSSIKIQERL